MKTCRYLLMLCLAILLTSCSAEAWRKSYQLTLSYDDFGPERIASPLLGPRGGQTTVIARQGNTQTTLNSAGIRYVNVQEAMLHLRRQAHLLPATAGNEALRQRLRATYERLYVLHRSRYDSLYFSSFSNPWVGMSRRLMLPPLLPSSI